MTGALAALLLLQLAPAPVQWERLSVTRSGTLSIDPGSIRREGDLVRFRTRIDFSDPDRIGAPTAIMDSYVDCRRRIWGFTHGQILRDDGSVMISRDVPPDDPDGRGKPFNPNATDDVVLERRVCGGPSA